MAAKYSTMVALGTGAPGFALADSKTGATVSLADFAGAPGLLVMFICNHCPYVKLIRAGLAAFGRDYGPRGLAIVAISANDVASHPADGPDEMAREASEAGYPFPYLYDESQDVALAYRAACTPDFFLYDGDLKLAYRGQFDAARPGNGVAVTGADLRAAADAVLGGKPAAGDQIPSVGCNIKWIPGNEPDYF